MSKVTSPKPRLCLPVEQWPAVDQERWAKACAPCSLLDDEGGELARLAPPSLKRYSMGWGRWTNFMGSHDPSALDRNPAERATKLNIQAYMDEMRRMGNSDRTILCRLEEVAVVTTIFDPTFDRKFIDRQVAVLKARVTPVRTKSHVKTADELVNLGFSLMNSASDPNNHQHALAYRDGLIIAFLALHVVRRRNLSSFLLKRNLIRQGDGYMVVFGASETKTGVPYERPLADVLVEPMNQYLAVWRPALMGRTRKSRTIDDSVWVAYVGAPMSPNAISACIEKRTREAFGKSISPHLFRDAAATTVAINDPGHVRVAAPLLGHRSLATTEKYYIQAKGLEAQRSYLEVLTKLKKEKAR